MAGLLDLPPEIILHIMNFAKWTHHYPDYQSILTWALASRHLTLCAQSILFSHVVLRQLGQVRNFSQVLSDPQMSDYLKDRVRVLEVFTKDELGLQAIHLHDVASLLPLLTNLRHLALDLDRFYCFKPASLPLLRHASDSLTSLTVKPSCGWTLQQLLERLPFLQRIHCVDQLPNSSQLPNHRQSCPVAFKEIRYTSLSKTSFKPLLWLTSHPNPQLVSLEFGSTMPEPLFFDLILSNVGARLRSLYIHELDLGCLPFLAKCTSLEEIVVGRGKDTPIELPLLTHAPPSVNHIKIFGDLFPLDALFPDLFETFPSLPSLSTLTLIDNSLVAPAFSNSVMEMDWMSRCHAMGIRLSLFHARSCNEQQYDPEAKEVGQALSMIRPSLSSLTQPDHC